jgi:peptidoglycan/LPS O-acetylase OafA/YrhL
MGMIRFLLAASVVITHSAPLFGKIGPGTGWNIGLNGDMAVSCFFIISGFLITMILHEKYSDLRTFYVTRFLRIYAPYTLALGLAFLPYLAGMSPSYDFAGAVASAKGTGNLAALLYFVVANGTIFGTEMAVYLASGDHFSDVYLMASHSEALQHGLHSWLGFLMVPQAWSLSLELQFYLMAPLLCRLKPGTLGMATLVLYFFRVSTLNSINDSGFEISTAGSILFSLHLFLFGALSYHLYREVGLARMEGLPKRLIGWVMVALSFLLVLKGYAMIRSGFVRWELYYILFALTVPFLFAVFRHAKWDRFLGELSYPIYLFHFALTPMAARFLPPSLFGIGMLAIVSLLAVGYLRTLHGPLERWRKRLGAKFAVSVHGTA